MIKLRVEDPQHLAPYQRFTYTCNDNISVLLKRFKGLKIMVEDGKVIVMGRRK